MRSSSDELTWRMVAARTLAIGAVVALVIAAHALVAGGLGIEAAGVRLSARSPVPPLVAACALAALAIAIAGLTRTRDLARWVAGSPASARAFAAILAASIAITGLSRGVDVAGSADSSGYVAQARLLASGRLYRDEPLAVRTTPRLGGAAVTPLGFRAAGDDHPTRQVPTYAPGLPLLMAIAERVAGARGPFLIVPIAGGLAVALAFLLGERLANGRAGLAAGALFASTPSFLFQVLQPMSDVPVTAAWLAAFACGMQGRAGASGVSSAIAIAIRPNLALLALPIGCLALVATERRTFLARFLAGLAPGVALVAFLHTTWYGAPWRSGYGAATDLYSVGNIAPNVLWYSRWLVESAPATAMLVLIGVLAATRGSTTVRMGVAFLGLNIAAYLPYATFQDWHYLRFVLPGLALMLPVGTAFVARRAGGPWIAASLAAATLLLCAWQLRIADGLDVFRVRSVERRYALAADWLSTSTPSNAVIATTQQSGSVVLNANRSVLRWDLIEEGRLDQAIRAVEATGRPVWLLVEAWELPSLRARHGAGFASLDWPPAASIAAAVPVTIHKVDDRARFQAGSEIPTTYLTDRRR